ncbi:hypothetical protein F4779DRAFT_579071 [Xylariaceae sp. FL0662B]|nr:hypothetical protein F4779DRAFT_579071 [Xylariaceae sp. FL0662B]
MAASRRVQPDLHVQLPSTPTGATLSDLPPISALFLINFDVKAGYTISWKASRPGVELDGIVEYKSLPSGLHTVTEDLIYFVNDGHAGLSAFINAPVEDSEARNARMLAVGVLVPLSYGRLGRAWKHAEGLKAMASKIAANSKDVAILEQYWAENQARAGADEEPTVPKESVESPSISFQTPHRPPREHLRNRSFSDGTAMLQPGHKLSPFHPAWSLTKLLDTFGPLIFPIQRAALLRKRILISGHAPVQEACDFVYDISILSNIPLSTYDLVSPRAPPYRLRPLFSIGVHDIPFLMDDAKPHRNNDDPPGNKSEAGTGWVACTTDSILSKKDTLWDMLITLPPPHASNAQKHIWPTVERPQGVPVKATQRDLRRFRSLKIGLARLNASPSASPTSPTTPRQSTPDTYLTEAEEKEIIEPSSWAALAYNGFMWWASAGEQAHTEQAEESAQDNALLANASSSMSIHRPTDLTPSISSLMPRHPSSSTATAPAPDEARVELSIIVYFHRLTALILDSLSDIVESTSSDEPQQEEEGEEYDDSAALLLESTEEDLDGRGIRIGSDAIANMGLDVWSAADAEFVREAARVYFGRKVYIEGKGVEVCGVRLC